MFYNPIIVNRLSKIAYETMFEDEWDMLDEKSIEKAMWNRIVVNILDVIYDKTAIDKLNKMVE